MGNELKKPLAAANEAIAKHRPFSPKSKSSQDANDSGDKTAGGEQQMPGTSVMRSSKELQSSGGGTSEGKFPATLIYD